MRKLKLKTKPEPKTEAETFELVSKALNALGVK